MAPSSTLRVAIHEAIEDDSDVLYEVNAPYEKVAKHGVIRNDPGLVLPWPKVAEAIMSDKDMELPCLAECEPRDTLRLFRRRNGGPILVTGDSGQLAWPLDHLTRSRF